MTLRLPEWTTLPAEQVRTHLDQVLQRLAELDDDVELGAGSAVAELVARPHALLTAAVEQLLRRYLAARSLDDLRRHPELADPEAVDAVMANFLVSRRPGSFAVGEVMIVCDNDLTVTLPAGTLFTTADGRTFVTGQVFTAKAEPELITSPSDRLIRPLSPGRYGFTVPVRATDVGPGGRLRRGTVLQLDRPPLGFVTAYAETDFVGGRWAETNEQIIGRLVAGLAARGGATRAGIAARIFDDADRFGRVRAISVVGAGDPEMTRDRLGPLAIPLGGRVDVYVRTDDLVVRRRIRVRAVCQGLADDGSTLWEASLPRDAYPGCYEILTLVRPDGPPRPAVVPDETIRGIDPSAEPSAPWLPDPVAAAFSRYQTLTVRFRDTTDAVPSGTVVEYDAEVTGLPLVAELQDYLNDRSWRPVAADLLVRLPVPCFVRVTFTVQQQAADRPPDLAGLKTAVAESVNTVGFTGRLYASRIADTVHGFLGENAGLRSIDLVGRLLRPDGRVVLLRASDVLAIPDDPSVGIGPRTVQFFAEPDDIVITFEPF